MTERHSMSAQMTELMNCPVCKTNEFVEYKSSEWTSWMACSGCGRKTQCTRRGGRFWAAKNWNCQAPQSYGQEVSYYPKGHEFYYDVSGCLPVLVFKVFK